MEREENFIFTNCMKLFMESKYYVRKLDYDLWVECIKDPSLIRRNYLGFVWRKTSDAYIAVLPDIRRVCSWDDGDMIPISADMIINTIINLDYDGRANRFDLYLLRQVVIKRAYDLILG